MTSEYDAVVIGCGAAGAAAAWRLASRGLSVLVLEQGGHVDRATSPALGHDWEAALQSRFHPDPGVRQGAHDYPVVADDTPIRPALFNAVGGGTVRWGAHFPRLRPADFRTHSLDGVGADWPIAYADLEQWFALTDRIMGVAGLAGDPANPPRAARPMPPLPLGPGPTRLAEAFNRLGWHWWPADSAIATTPYDGRGACNHCGPCGLPCVPGARGDAAIAYVPRLLAAGARLETQARVLAIAPDAQRVTWRQGGVTHHTPTRAVVLAANGMGSARLLLANGLANGSGLVGRGLMHHPTAIVTGRFAERLDGHKGPFACALFSQHFIEHDSARGFARGYQLQALRGGGPVQTALGGYMARLPWGRTHHAAFEATFAHSVSLTVTAEDFPEDSNRVTLDPRLTDSDGLPAPCLHYRVSENSRRMLDHGILRATEVLREAGAQDVFVNPLASAAGFHFLGTARMGNDPKTSVTDAECRAHEMPNLVVPDGSVFVTAGAVNPTSTIQAIALRAADALATRLRARPA